MDQSRQTERADGWMDYAIRHEMILDRFNSSTWHPSANGVFNLLHESPFPFLSLLACKQNYRNEATKRKGEK